MGLQFGRVRLYFKCTLASKSKFVRCASLSTTEFFRYFAPAASLLNSSSKQVGTVSNILPVELE